MPTLNAVRNTAVIFPYALLYLVNSQPKMNITSQIEKALKFTATELSWTGSGAGAIDVGAFLAQAPDYKYVESLSLSENSKTLKVGDTYTLNPTILPSDAANKNIVYE